MKGYARYFGKKLIWFIVTFIAAFLLNFIPASRLMPGDAPVAGIVARMAQGMSNATGVQAIYQQYTELFGTNKPMLTQFFIYVKNVFHGDFGYLVQPVSQNRGRRYQSFHYVDDLLQFPAIIVGWLIGNILGALAAYIKGALIKPSCRSVFLERFTGIWHGNHFAGYFWCRI